MPRATRLGAAALLVAAALPFVQTPYAQPAENSLKEWLSVPRTESGIVVIIDQNNVSAVSLKTENSTLDTAKWRPGVPFVRQYRVPPGSYQLRVSAPIKAIHIDAKAGDLTYVKFEPYHDDAGHIGVHVVGWVGPVSDRVEKLLASAQMEGISDVYDTPRIETQDKFIEIATTPPWPVPPKLEPTPRLPPPQNPPPPPPPSRR